MLQWKLFIIHTKGTRLWRNFFRKEHELLPKCNLLHALASLHHLKMRKLSVKCAFHSVLVVITEIKHSPRWRLKTKSVIIWGQQMSLGIWRLFYINWWYDKLLKIFKNPNMPRILALMLQIHICIIETAMHLHNGF